ncbi:MAG: Holliday junction branch migration protein RuvA [Gammaproteobacteria bacterium]|jgi:Holliday junction DNA helicase RuvA
MIGYLSGRLIYKRPPQLMLEVQGVGYEVEAPMSTFYRLPEVGQEVSLFTHLVVREDAHTLFGFSSESERGMFRALIKVNGVGPRLAVTILSGIAVDDFVRCVQERDAISLTRLPGVGRKTAERLVVEMADRIDGEAAGPGAPTGEGGTSAAEPGGEAYSALVALGYKPQEAGRMIRKVDQAGLSSEEIIRRALQGAAAR